MDSNYVELKTPGKWLKAVDLTWHWSWKFNINLDAVFSPYYLEKHKKPLHLKTSPQYATSTGEKTFFLHPYHPWDWHIFLYGWLIFMVNVRKYTSPMDALGHQKITTESAGNIWGMLQAAWWLVLHACSGMILAEFVLDVFFSKAQIVVYICGWNHQICGMTQFLWNDLYCCRYFQISFAHIRLTYFMAYYELQMLPLHWVWSWNILLMQEILHQLIGSSSQFIPLFTGCHTSQMVIAGFPNHQSYVATTTFCHSYTSNFVIHLPLGPIASTIGTSPSMQYPDPIRFLPPGRTPEKQINTCVIEVPNQKLSTRYSILYTYALQEANISQLFPRGTSSSKMLW